MDTLDRVDELYRDDRMVVVNKPSGLVVHKGWGRDTVNAMKIVRKMTGRYVHPVHRLDRGTSGALVFAFDSETAARLSEHFRDQTIRKRYLALVRGVVPDEGVVDYPVLRKLKGAGESTDRVEAVTRFRRLGVALGRYSLIEAFPETGRLHQIRRHMKHLSHPLMGDTRYGDGKENRRLRDDYGLSRLALHASSIRFHHPYSGEPIAIEAPTPDDLRGPLERIGIPRETIES